jgi:IS30 family transposase
MFQWYHYQKLSMREIARRLDRSHTTISREIKRNMSHCYVPTWYPHPAQLDYQIRIRDRGKREKLKSKATREFVEEKIKIGWSPEIIAGRLKHEQKLDYACHESIYQYIYREQPELISYLPRKHKKRRKKYPKRKYPTKISEKTSILDRPQVVNHRIIPGHWESDSMESKHRSCALNVLIERSSRLMHITRLASKKSVDTKKAIVSRLEEHPNNFVQSITYDNGPENAAHLDVNQSLSCQSYFCQAYHSWEKGSVEQVIGLIRRYLPKCTDLRKVTDNMLNHIEKQLNSRPRKCLGYKTPLEAYNELSGALSP